MPSSKSRFIRLLGRRAIRDRKFVALIYRADRHVVAALRLSKQAPEREYHEHVEQKP
jgi:hypothetical protein